MIKLVPKYIKISNLFLVFWDLFSSNFSYWSLASPASFDLKWPVPTNISITLPNCFIDTLCQPEQLGWNRTSNDQWNALMEIFPWNSSLKKQHAEFFIKSWKSTLFEICAFLVTDQIQLCSSTYLNQVIGFLQIQIICVNLH